MDPAVREGREKLIPIACLGADPEKTMEIDAGMREKFHRGAAGGWPGMLMKGRRDAAVRGTAAPVSARPCTSAPLQDAMCYFAAPASPFPVRGPGRLPPGLGL